jgi:hypothetical protein
VIVPSVSVAVALTVTVAGAINVAPAEGLVRLTVGGAFTVMLTPLEIVVAPALSVAFAVKV